MDGFHRERFICALKAQGDSIIYRTGTHTRFANKSHFTLDENNGLNEGLYRLLGFAEENTEEKDFSTWDMYAVGARLKVESDTAFILDKYSEEFGLYGEGTEKNPYLISGASHLTKLRHFTNDKLKNKQLTPTTYFQQVANINADGISQECSSAYGWDPIGNSPQTPFRGVYMVSDSAFNTNSTTISKLYIDRLTTVGIGLFGFVEGTVIKTLKIKGAEVVGGTFVGALVGAIQTPGDALWPTVLENCSVENCTVEGPTLANPETPSDGFGTGGLIGLIDQRLNVVLSECSSSGSKIFGSYGVGGLVGISSIFSIHNVGNKGEVSGKSYIGGISGFMLTGMLSTAINCGFIQGKGDFVGGAIGRAGNDIIVNYCGNFGTILNSQEGRTGGIR